MRFVALVLFVLVGTLAFGQMSLQDFEKKYKYDMVKQDKINVRFEGETYWLRAATFKGNTIRLTFYKKGDTPTTFRESLSFIKIFAGEDLNDYAASLIAGLQPKLAAEPVVLENNSRLPTKQKVLNLFLSDTATDVFENLVVQLRQPVDGSLILFLHQKRIGLTDARKDTDLATREMGKYADDWILALDQLTYSF